MSIKPKMGNCESCGYFGGLIAKKCQSCYWKHRASKKKTEAPKPLKSATLEEGKKAVEKATDPHLKQWFVNQLMKAPKNCEECGTPLRRWINFMPFAIIAHILPKRKNQFPELATHPENRMYFCGDCHTDFDHAITNPWTMNSLEIMRERYRQMEPFIEEGKKYKVPKYLTEKTYE